MTETSKIVCPKCGKNEHVTKFGLKPTKFGKVQRFQCTVCGHIFYENRTGLEPEKTPESKIVETKPVVVPEQISVSTEGPKTVSIKFESTGDAKRDQEIREKAIKDEIESQFAAYHKSSDEWYQALLKKSSQEELNELNKRKLAELHESVPKMVFIVNKITDDPNDPWNNLIDTDRTLGKEAREFDRGSRGKK